MRPDYPHKVFSDQRSRYEFLLLTLEEFTPRKTSFTKAISMFTFFTCITW